MAIDPNDTRDRSFDEHEQRPPRSGPSRPHLSELPEKILEMLRKSPLADVEHQVKSLVASTVARLDLVTREEFDIQQAVVERMRERIEALEAQLDKDRSK